VARRDGLDGVDVIIFVMCRRHYSVICRRHRNLYTYVVPIMNFPMQVCETGLPDFFGRKC
jgi:hypothetical protein